MKTYDYWDFVDLVCIKDLQKAENDWFGFRVSKAGVALIDQRELCNPIGNNQLFSEEERRGRKESLIRPLALLEFVIQRPTMAPNRLTGVEIVNRSRKTIVPPSPPMQPTWQESYVKEGNLLLEFPCNKEDLRSFIKLTRLDFMLPPGHELINDAHNANTGQSTTGNLEPPQQQDCPEAKKIAVDKKQGGRPLKTMSRAIDLLMEKLEADGNLVVAENAVKKNGDMEEFLKIMKKTIVEGGKSYDKDMDEHIRAVKITKPYKITTEERQYKEQRGIVTSEKSAHYYQAALIKKIKASLKKYHSQ